jgi:hypothetical protein
MKFPTSLCLSSLLLCSFAHISADEPTEKKPEQKAPLPRCSAKKGSTLYKEYGDAMHKRRFQNELSPSEWMTTLLYHRILVPFTAEEYCSLLDYFTDCDSGLNTEDTAQEIPPSFSNEDKSGAQTPHSCKFGKLPKSNFLIKGSTFTTFTALEDHNNTFLAGLNPLFLWRYETRCLYEMELEIGLE